ncbi:MAG TPA: DUF2800 domain-containing protein [Caulobacteraceae bacterium]|jgi:hypothetical protein
MAAHARVGPSSLSRVILCRGSVRATDGLPNPSSEAAAEGSCLHDIAAECLQHGFEPEDWIGRTMSHDGFEFVIGYGDGETDPTCINEALDWLRTQPGQFFIETRVELDPWMPGQFGRLDVAIYTPEILTVFDWKFGRGVLVPVINNDQCRAYALGILRRLRALGYADPKRIRIIIEQPRCPGGARYHTPWEISLEDLLTFGDFVAKVMSEIDDPNAPRHAGIKQCKFCAAKEQPGGCDAHSQFLLDLMGSKFDELDGDADQEPTMPRSGSLTPERRSYIVRHASMVSQWFEHLHTETLADALAGRDTPGLKAIAGQLGNRVYTDDKAAEALLVPALAADAFTTKLKSPAQAEKLMKPGRKKPGHPQAWADLQTFITQGAGKPVLVSIDDPRPALMNVDDKFDDE